VQQVACCQQAKAMHQMAAVPLCFVVVVLPQRSWCLPHQLLLHLLPSPPLNLACVSGLARFGLVVLTMCSAPLLMLLLLLLIFPCCAGGCVGCGAG
jgi:hypothetical protein